MMVLITYDVETITPAGAKRLRKVAKVCQNYGLRVQNSVFECMVDSAQFASLKGILTSIIDTEKDGIRIYFMGNNWDKHIETIGKTPSFNQESCLIV